MKRLDFLKKLGIGVGVAIVAPSTFIKHENTEFISNESMSAIDSYKPKSISTNIKPSKEFMDVWCTSTLGDLDNIY